MDEHFDERIAREVKSLKKKLIKNEQKFKALGLEPPPRDIIAQMLIDRYAPDNK